MAEYKDTVKKLVKAARKEDRSVKKLAEALLPQDAAEIKRAAKDIGDVELTDEEAATLATDQAMRGAAEAEA